MLYFDVRNYGAKGDGVTDDTPAINLAIAAALAGKGAVYLPPGAYKISAALSVLGSVAADGQAYPSFVGAGRNLVTINYTGGAGTAITVGGSNAFLGERLEFGGFSLANTGGGTGTTGVLIQNMGKSLIRDLFVQGFSAQQIAVGQISGGAAPNRACYYNEFRSLYCLGASLASPATYGLYIYPNDWANANNFNLVYTKWAQTHIYQGGNRNVFTGLHGEITQAGFLAFIDFAGASIVLSCEYEGSGGVGVGFIVDTTNQIFLLNPEFNGVPTVMTNNQPNAVVTAIPQVAGQNATQGLIWSQSSKPFALPGLGALGQLGSVGTPTIGGVNAGISGTPTVNGNDVHGTITFVTTGTAPAAGAILFTVSFSGTTVFAGTNVTALLTASDGRTASYSSFSEGTASFQVVNQQNLNNATTYKLDYFVAG